MITIEGTRNKVSDQFLKMEGWITFVGRRGFRLNGKKMHYYPKNNGISLCGKNTPDLLNRSLVKFYVFSDHERQEESYCGQCVRCLANYKVSGKTAKQIAAENTYTELPKKLKKRSIDTPIKLRTIVWMPAGCSEPGCKEFGMFPTLNPQKPKFSDHYCIKHNTKIR